MQIEEWGHHKEEAELLACSQFKMSCKYRSQIHNANIQQYIDTAKHEQQVKCKTPQEI